MDERVPSEVLVFAPKQTAPDRADPLDQVGRTLMTMVQQAANSSKENVERAVSWPTNYLSSCELPRTGYRSLREKWNVYKRELLVLSSG